MPNLKFKSWIDSKLYPNADKLITKTISYFLSIQTRINMFGRVCSGLVFLTLISLGATEYAYIEETNTHQLDMDSFWAMAHKIEKHVIIELYTSASWCSKYF
mgnify:FL=1